MRPCFPKDSIGAGEALRILLNEASKIERSHHRNAQPFERSDEWQGYANGFQPKTRS